MAQMTRAEAHKRLVDGLRAWYAKEKKGAKTLQKPKTTIWKRMSDIDSKAAMRSSAVFSAVLGVDLNEKLVRHGGYPSLEAMIDDLVPKMIKHAEEEGVVLA